MTKAYSINYDLRGPGRNYDGLFDEIRKCPGYQHTLESTWLVVTNETPQQLFDRLRPELDENDRLLVIEVRNNKQGWLTQDQWDWINNNLP